MAICKGSSGDEKSYFRMLLGQYRLVDADRKGKAPAAVAAIDEIIQKGEQEDAVSWADLYTFEKALLLVLSRAEMECRLLFLADMYREIAGDKNFTSRTRIKMSELKGVTDEALQGELGELVDDLYRHLALYTACRENRRKIMCYLLVFLLALFVFSVVWLCLNDGNMPPMFYVMISGGIGGMISAARRLQDAASMDSNVLTYIDLKYGWLNVLLAPVYGAVFSLLVLLFFTSGFLKGDLFPAMMTMSAQVAEEADSVSLVMSEFFTNTYPITGSDCAKLMVWSFIAGFAEKFVPDTLDRLIVRSQKSEQKK
jgi:hypothetical protein